MNRLLVACALLTACSGEATPTPSTSAPPAEPAAPAVTAPEAVPPTPAPTAAAAALAIDATRIALPEGTVPGCAVADGADVLVLTHVRDTHLLRVGASGTSDLGAIEGLGFPSGCRMESGVLYAWGDGEAVLVRIDPATAAATRVALPEEIGMVAAVLPHGDELFVADASAQFFRCAAAGACTRLGGNEVIALDDGRARASTDVGRPAGMVLVGDALIVPEQQGTVTSLALADGTMTALAGVRFEHGATDGVGEAARLGTPSGVVAVGERVLFADGGCVRAFDPTSRAVTTVGGECEAGIELPDGARLRHIARLSAGGPGELLAVDVDAAALARLTLR